MNKDQEKAMLKSWRRYLNPETEDDYFDPPPCYARGFADGIKHKGEDSDN